MRALVLLCSILAATSAGAASITVVNLDDPGEGFKDRTPVAPVAGNPGTTLGEQRLNAFAAAAQAWGRDLVGPVTIQVAARMDALACSSTSAVLGSAGPVTVDANFAGAPRRDTWYPQALANALAGTDRQTSYADISARFNSAIDDDPNCMTGVTWWYGIGAPPPSGTIDFFDTVLHEIGHGLGVATFVNTSTGEFLHGIPDAYSWNLEDHSMGVTWPRLNDGARMLSAVDTGDLHWVGPRVTAARGELSGGVAGGHVRMYAPSPLQGGSSVSHFDTALSPNELMEPYLTSVNDRALTIELLADIGWPLQTALFTDGFESGNTTRWTTP